MVDIWTKMMAVKQRNLDHAPDCPLADNRYPLGRRVGLKKQFAKVMGQALKEGTVSIEDLREALDEAMVTHVMEE